MHLLAKEFQHHQRRAQHDRGVCQIKCVPVMPADVKGNEVGDAVAQEAIKHVSQRPAQNQREAALAQAPARAARCQQPHQHGDHGHRKGDEQRTSPGIFGIGEEAEGDSGVGGVYQIQEAGNYDAQRTYGSMLFHRVFAELVCRQRAQRNNPQRQPTETRDGWHQDCELPAARPPSRSISFSAATQRSHFLPIARSTVMCKPSMPLGVAPSALASAISTCETMNRPGKYAAYFRSSAATSTFAASVTRASSPEVMVFAARTGSSAFRTSSRTCSKRSQLFARASSSTRSSSAATGNVAMCTLTGSEAARGRCFHTSSAVNTVIGAISRSNVLAMRYTAVCAERRPRLFGANVYRRSFSTSK